MPRGWQSLTNKHGPKTGFELIAFKRWNMGITTSHNNQIKSNLLQKKLAFSKLFFNLFSFFAITEQKLYT